MSDIIDLDAFRRKKQSNAERDYCERLAEYWIVYDELKDIAPYLPKAIILKIMTLCRKTLQAMEDAQADT